MKVLCALYFCILTVSTEWVKEFYDNFNREIPDLGNWEPEDSDTFSCNNVKIENGSLILSVSNKNKTGSSISTTKSWVSGKFEIRVKLPIVDKIVSEIVLTPTYPNPDGVEDGEITLIELNEDLVESGVRTGKHNKFYGITPDITIDKTQFVTFTFTLINQTITYALNGLQYHSISLNQFFEADKGSKYENKGQPFNTAFFLTFKLWKDSSVLDIEEESSEERILVDYVRVSQWIEKEELNTENGQWNLVWYDLFSSHELNNSKWFPIYNDYYEPESCIDVKKVGAFQALTLSVKQTTDDVFRGAEIRQKTGNWRNGRFKIRVRLPKGKTYFSIYLMPLREVYGSASYSGYISIVELGSHDPPTIRSGLYAGNDSYFYGVKRPLEQRFIDKFNVFTIDWLDNHLIWKLNGLIYNIESLDRYFQLNEESNYHAKRLPFDNEYYLVIVNSEDANYKLNEGSVTENTLSIDFVKIYKWFSNSTQEVEVDFASLKQNPKLFECYKECVKDNPLQTGIETDVAEENVID